MEKLDILLDKSITPKKSFVRQVCHGCGSKEYTCYNLHTEMPEYVVHACKNDECQAMARQGVKDFFMHESEIYLDREKSKEMAGKVKVRRSSGEIEDGWTVYGIVINPELLVSVINYNQNISKTIRKEKFMECNPDLEGYLKEFVQGVFRYHMEGIFNR